MLFSVQVILWFSLCYVVKDPLQTFFVHLFCNNVFKIFICLMSKSYGKRVPEEKKSQVNLLQILLHLMFIHLFQLLPTLALFFIKWLILLVFEIIKDSWINFMHKRSLLTTMLLSQLLILLAWIFLVFYKHKLDKFLALSVNYNVNAMLWRIAHNEL